MTDAAASLDRTWFSVVGVPISRYTLFVLWYLFECYLALSTLFSIISSSTSSIIYIRYQLMCKLGHIFIVLGDGHQVVSQISISSSCNLAIFSDLSLNWWKTMNVVQRSVSLDIDAKIDFSMVALQDHKHQKDNLDHQLQIRWTVMLFSTMHFEICLCISTQFVGFCISLILKFMSEELFNHAIMIGTGWRSRCGHDVLDNTRSEN